MKLFLCIIVFIGVINSTYVSVPNSVVNHCLEESNKICIAVPNEDCKTNYDSCIEEEMFWRNKKLINCFSKDCIGMQCLQRANIDCSSIYKKYDPLFPRCADQLKDRCVKTHYGGHDDYDEKKEQENSKAQKLRTEIQIYCDKHSRSRCSKDKNIKMCQNTIYRKCTSFEKEWRKTNLGKCGCEVNECPQGKCRNRKLTVCQKKCLKEGCTNRAQNFCRKTPTDECIKNSLKKCKLIQVNRYKHKLIINTNGSEQVALGGVEPN